VDERDPETDREKEVRKAFRIIPASETSNQDTVEPENSAQDSRWRNERRKANVYTPLKRRREDIIKKLGRAAETRRKLRNVTKRP
jgi:hypothetical protein